MPHVLESVEAYATEGEALGYILLDRARDNCDEGHCNSFAESLIS